MDDDDDDDVVVDSGDGDHDDNQVFDLYLMITQGSP